MADEGLIHVLARPVQPHIHAKATSESSDMYGKCVLAVGLCLLPSSVGNLPPRLGRFWQQWVRVALQLQNRSRGVGLGSSLSSLSSVCAFHQLNVFCSPAPTVSARPLLMWPHTRALWVMEYRCQRGRLHRTARIMTGCVCVFFLHGFRFLVTVFCIFGISVLYVYRYVFTLHRF